MKKILILKKLRNMKAIWENKNVENFILRKLKNIIVKEIIFFFKNENEFFLKKKS